MLSVFNLLSSGINYSALARTTDEWPCIRSFLQAPKAHIFIVIDTWVSYINLNTIHKLEELQVYSWLHYHKFSFQTCLHVLLPSLPFSFGPFSLMFQSQCGGSKKVARMKHFPRRPLEQVIAFSWRSTSPVHVLMVSSLPTFHFFQLYVTIIWVHIITECNTFNELTTKSFSL